MDPCIFVLYIGSHCCNFQHSVQDLAQATKFKFRCQRRTFRQASVKAEQQQQIHNKIMQNIQSIKDKMPVVS